MKMIRQKTPHVNPYIFKIIQIPFYRSLESQIITFTKEQSLFITAAVIDMIVRLLFKGSFWHKKTLDFGEKEIKEMSALSSSNPHLGNQARA